MNIKQVLNTSANEIFSNLDAKDGIDNKISL